MRAEVAGLCGLTCGAAEVAGDCAAEVAGLAGGAAEVAGGLAGGAAEVGSGVAGCAAGGVVDVGCSGSGAGFASSAAAPA